MPEKSSRKAKGAEDEDSDDEFDFDAESEQPDETLLKLTLYTYHSSKIFVICTNAFKNDILYLHSKHGKASEGSSCPWPNPQKPAAPACRRQCIFWQHSS